MTSVQRFRGLMDEYFPEYFWVGTTVFNKELLEQRVTNLNTATQLYQEISDCPEQFDSEEEELLSSEICSSIAHAIEKVIESSCLEQEINIHQSKNYRKSIDHKIEKSPKLMCFIAEEWDYLIKGKHFKLAYRVEIAFELLNCPNALSSMLEYVEMKALEDARIFQE